MQGMKDMGFILTGVLTSGFGAPDDRFHCRAAPDISCCPTTADITATPSAPAAMTCGTFQGVIPPIAITGRDTAAQISRSTPIPWPCPASSFDVVGKIGLSATYPAPADSAATASATHLDRDTDDEPWRGYPPGIQEGEIVLPQVDTVCS